ncbi:MAG: arylsulfatase [Planctomycetota bacterium]
MRRAALSLVCLTAPFISPFVAAANGAQSPARRPNVVVILADDLGAGELGCYGQTRIRTPHIDSIAARGVRFTDGYSGAPVCAPSRCALLTGRHTGHAAVRDNWEAGGWGPDEPEGQLPLPAEEITLAERLRALGYRTGGFGKWGLGGPGTEGAPERQGFDHFHGYLCQRVAHNYFPTHLWRNGERVEIPGAKWFSAHQKLAEPLDGPAAYAARFGGPTASYAPQRIADDMLSWLDEAAASDDPFFLYYASVIPHLALQVPDAYVERYPEDWDAAPYLGQRGYLPHPSPRRAYAAMITFLDDQVGRVLALLEERGELENTLVLFTSDNGATYVGGVDTAFFASHDGRRGHKGQVWEGGVRVPFLAMWPGRIPAGSTSAHVVSGVDVTATVLEAAGARPAAGLDSVSLLAAARGDASAPRPPLYWEHRPAGAQAVRDGRWKLVRAGLKPKQTERVELYDLTADPAEARDLAAEHPETVERLRAVLADQHTPNRRFPLPKTDPPRPRRESR